MKNLQLSKQPKLIWVLAVLALLVVLNGAVPTDTNSQFWVGYVVVGLMLLLNELKQKPIFRILMFACTAFIMLRYFFWRTFFTIGSDTFFGTVFSFLLYAAEAYCIILTFLGMFINIYHVRRDGMAQTGDPQSWPTVDVLIPSFNESVDILRDTIIAATQMRYAENKLNVYLCDDGGTDVRRNDADPLIANAAWARHYDVKALCELLGVHYLTRADNTHAKAGNLNAAMTKTSGELIVIFDADHMPTVDFLERTVGYFQTDEKIFLVQTPHFFINADPVERNLDLFGKIPGEGDMFYSQIQPGLDFWNAAFFCGSAAVMRRNHLDSVGGMRGESITEDAEAALQMHSRGLRSVFVSRPLIAGLQPETYSSFVVQRLRWAQGMVQIFLLNNPLINQNLSIFQKLSYFSNTFFWFFSFVRFIFIISPAMYLVFGLHVYTATVTQILAYTLPHFIVSMLIMDYLYGKVRAPFISEIYEILQSMYAFVSVVRVIANPRAPTFRVTPKGEDLSRSYISSLAGPFYMIYFLSVISILFGVWRYFAFPEPDARSVTLMTGAWEFFNLIILNTALGVLHEKKKTRGQIRMKSNITAMLHLSDGVNMSGRVVDVTMGGAMVEFDEAIPQAYSGLHCQVTLNNQALNTQSVFPVELRYVLGKDQRTKIGMSIKISFEPDNLQNYKELVALNYGDSERWNEFMLSRQQRRTGIWRGFFMIIRLGFRNMRMDYPHFLADSWSMLRSWLLEIWSNYFSLRCSILGRYMLHWMTGK
jgi:cellulose synthase (UDP-forming)